MYTMYMYMYVRNYNVYMYMYIHCSFTARQAHKLHHVLVWYAINVNFHDRHYTHLRQWP